MSSQIYPIERKRAAENFCENLMLGDSLLNHIAEPEGWIISNDNISLI